MEDNRKIEIQGDMGLDRAMDMAVAIANRRISDYYGGLTNTVSVELVTFKTVLDGWVSRDHAQFREYIFEIKGRVLFKGEEYGTEET